MSPRRPLRRALVAVAVLAALATVVVPGGGASGATRSHDFPDVPPSNPFHDDISWLVDEGFEFAVGPGPAFLVPALGLGALAGALLLNLLHPPNPGFVLRPGGLQVAKSRFDRGVRHGNPHRGAQCAPDSIESERPRPAHGPEGCSRRPT